MVKKFDAENQLYRDIAKGGIAIPKLSVSFELEIVDIVDNDDADVVARCFYPDEGNSVKIVRGLSEAEVRVAICHEIGHLIDWYLSEGSQSSKTETREASANNICIGLVKMCGRRLQMKGE